MDSEDSSTWQSWPRRTFFDDSLLEHQKLLLYAAGEFPIKPESNPKLSPVTLRKSNSMHDIRYQTFRDDDYLPEDLRVILI